jgi:hypothetical protein
MSSPSDLFVSKMKLSSIQSVAYSTGFEKSLDTAMVVEFSGPLCCGDDNRGLALYVVGAITVDSYVPGLKAASVRYFALALHCCVVHGPSITPNSATRQTEPQLQYTLYCVRSRRAVER